ncbi:MAG TPA: trypsin-like peptidase domain-containing protein [Gemmataceae bacterium]|nr:trypsin-like peptidase domain-containing protein [Gemmataceae bacterium]
MYRTTRLLVLACALAGGGLPAAAQDKDRSRIADALALEETIQDAIQRAEPSIACVLVSRSEDGRGFLPEKDDYVPEHYGSGVVIDPAGLILTNYHVVRDGTKFYVRLPGGKAGYAAVWAADQRSDLAVLRVDHRAGKLPALPIGDGSRLRKGQFLISLANPFAAGFRDGSPSASWGIVSNLRRRGPGSPNEMERSKSLYHYNTLIQTDARLNLGCSGGALIDLKGNLVGITTALAAVSGSETPGGFALPTDAGIRRIIEKLKQGEEVEYGFLGVSEDVRRARRTEGVVLGTVMPGSPADRAGLMPGYRLLSVNGLPVNNRDDLFLHIGTQLAGSTVRLEFRRGPDPTAPLDVKQVTLAKFPLPENKTIATNRRKPVAGIRVDYASTLYARILEDRLFGGALPRGVAVREVEPKSAADAAQVQVDSVITHVNSKPVDRPADFYREAANARGPVELTVLTPDGRTSRVKVEVK